MIWRPQRNPQPSDAKPADARDTGDVLMDELIELRAHSAVAAGQVEEIQQLTAEALALAEAQAILGLQLRAVADQASADVVVRAGAVIGAHRALIADVMRRMVERETERARRESQKRAPHRMRLWLEDFYQGHQDLCVNALRPAIAVHLAWSGRPEDPETLTRALVGPHIRESKRQIAAVLDGDGDDLPAAVEALTQRWRTRNELIGERLVQETLARMAEQEANGGHYVG